MKFYKIEDNINLYKTEIIDSINLYKTEISILNKWDSDILPLNEQLQLISPPSQFSQTVV